MNNQELEKINNKVAETSFLSDKQNNVYNLDQTKKICYECETQYTHKHGWLYCQCSYKNINHGNLLSGF